MKAPHAPPAHDIEGIDKSLSEEEVHGKEENELAQVEGDVVADTLRDIFADVCNCPHFVLTFGCISELMLCVPSKDLTASVKKDPSVQSLISDCS